MTSAKRSGLGTAPHPRSHTGASPQRCTGCDAPFSVVRKVRHRGTHAFIATVSHAAGRTGQVPIALCGSCVSHLRAGSSMFQLPAFARHANHLERLVLADQQGPLQ